MKTVLGILLWIFVICGAKADPPPGPQLPPILHRHPPADAAAHEKFYSTWYMPDNPTKSCCNKADCYPTEARFHNGHWQGKRREDGKWLFIPEAKIERHRDNPDGRSHMCAPPPNYFPLDGVLCFTLGSGT